jgi:hypothetical protein
MTYAIIILFVFFKVINIFTRKIGALSAVLGLLVIMLTKNYNLLWNFSNAIIVLSSFLPLGLLSFYLSLVLTNLNSRAIRSYFPPKLIFWDYIVIDRLYTLRFLFISFYEELLWRGAFLFLFDNIYLGLLLSSFLFALTHTNKKREIFIAEIFDIFIFAIFQGILMILFRNVYLLILIHTIRNLLIYYWALYRSTHIGMTKEVPC